MTDPVYPVAPREEWLARYKRRFVEIAGVTPAQAEMFAEEPFEQISEFFEDDPEGAADEEMSYWEAE
jgi:hypothetical protein